MLRINPIQVLRWGRAWFATLVLTVGVGAPRAIEAQVSVNELEVHLALTTPRGTLTDVIPVRNEETRAQQVRVVVGDWVRDSLGNNVFLEAGDVSESCGARLQVFPSTFQIAPGATELVRVAYEPTADDVGCWSIVYVETVNPPPPQIDAQGSFLTIEIRTGVKIYVHREHAVALGEVEDVAVATAWRPIAPVSRDSALVREVSVWFHNTGTAHVRMRTSLEVRDAQGALVQNIAGPEAPMTPGAKRIIRIGMPDLPAGDYVAIVLLDYGGAEIAAAQADFRVP